MLLGIIVSITAKADFWRMQDVKIIFQRIKSLN